VTIAPETVAVEAAVAAPSRLGAIGAMPRIALVGGCFCSRSSCSGRGSALHALGLDGDRLLRDRHRTGGSRPPPRNRSERDGHLVALLYATRIDLGIAVAAVAIAVSVGTVVGGLIGYIGGWLDEIGMRTMDIVQSFPPSSSHWWSRRCSAAASSTLSR